MSATIDAPPPTGSTASRRPPATALASWAIAAALAAAWLVAAPAVGDLSTQDYRAELGPTLWDNAWYGGHHMPGYSVLFPLLSAPLGARVVGALATVAAVVLFERLVRDLPGAAVGAPWFAVGAATMLLTGRLTFALGLAFGLAAVLAAGRGRLAPAIGLAATAGLASPVVAAFLALVAAAWWIDARGWRPAVAGWWRAVAFGAGAVLPAGLVMLAFPEGGTFPFDPSAFWPPLLLVGVLAVVLRERAPRVLVIAIVLYIGALIASFALETPMGGNASRLGAVFAGPIAACVLWPHDRRALALLALPLVYWQWIAPVTDVVDAHGIAASHERYHAPLIDYLDSRPGEPFRVEIPLSENFWEARWVAPELPLARGWERQLDRARNAIFYDDGPPTPASYRRWLDANAVRYVALPDVALDYSARAEARLIRRGLPYLREVWRGTHWRVFEVAGARGLARGAGARAIALDHDSVRLRAARPGTIDLRVRFTPYWRIVRGSGCVSQGPDGWTRVRASAAGELVLGIDFALGRVRASGPRCDHRPPTPSAAGRRAPLPAAAVDRPAP